MFSRQFFGIFSNSGEEPLFTIADIFGYIFTFLIIMFIWSSYNAASDAGQRAKTSVINTVNPIVEDIEKRTTETKELASFENNDKSESSSYFGSLIESGKSLIDSFSPDKAGKTLQSINHSINEIIEDAGSDSTKPVPRQNRGHKDNKRRSSQDTLSPL